jgi:hypothetical protein
VVVYPSYAVGILATGKQAMGSDLETFLAEGTLGELRVPRRWRPEERFLEWKLEQVGRRRATSDN